MHGQNSTTSPFGFTSPIDPQVREQLEQLRPREQHERLLIAVFVLDVALRLATVPPLARELADEILATLRTTRALPPPNAGWNALFDVLNRLVDLYNGGGGGGLLGNAAEGAFQRLTTYECAVELMVAGLSQMAGSALFGKPPGPVDSEWIPLFEGRHRIRAKLAQWPGISLDQLIGLEARALVFGNPPVLRNRIVGAELPVPLAAHMAWRISPDATAYVEADLSRFPCDPARSTVILPDGARLQIAVQPTEYVQWAYDRIQVSHAEWLRSTGGYVHIENSSIVSNSPGATQVIGSAGARVNSPETVPPAPPRPESPAEPTAAWAEPPTETAAAADPSGMEEPLDVKDPVDQEEVADAAAEVPEAVNNAVSRQPLPTDDDLRPDEQLEKPQPDERIIQWVGNYPRRTKESRETDQEWERNRLKAAKTASELKGLLISQDILRRADRILRSRKTSVGTPS